MKQTLENITPIKALGLAGLILLFFFSLSFVLQIPDRAASQISSMLKRAGFERAEIGDLSFLPNGIRAQDIKLDRHGFDTIGRLDLEVSWPRFLTGGTIDAVTIDSLSLSRRAEDFSHLLRQSVAGLQNLPPMRVAIRGAVVDIDTKFGAIRINADTTIDPPNDQQEQKIQARITAQQYQLGFESLWSGKIIRNEIVNITAEFLDGRLHMGPLKVTRFNGWADINIGRGNYSVQQQIEAGAASLFDVPLQDVSFISDINGGNNTALFRASMAGMPDTLLSLDMNIGVDQHDTQLMLKGASFGRFLAETEKSRGIPRNVPKTLQDIGPFAMTAQYQPDKRFSGGPLPFSLMLQGDGKTLIDGNFLIYPDELDIRGSAEMQSAVAPAIRSYFEIDKKNLDGNFIRLDGDLEKFVKMPEDQP